jgi:hypothetical protein
VTRLLREHPAIEVELDREGSLAPIARDYFKVVGARWLALVYLDRVDGSWHLERLYD